MSFLAEVRAYLRYSDVLPIGDLQEYQRNLLELLEKREKETDDPPPLELGERLEGFVRIVELRLLSRGFQVEEIPEAVRCAIACALGMSWWTFFMSAARKRVIHEAASVHRTLQNHRWQDVPGLAREIGAVRASRAGTSRVTEIGQGLLDLPRRDAVAWLLHAEVARATHAYDPLLVHRNILRELVAHPDCAGTDEYWEDIFVGWDHTHVEQLCQLGVVTRIVTGPGGDPCGYHVHGDYLPLLQDLAEGRDTPTAIQVAALLEDDTHARMPRTIATSAVATTARQTRMVVHEISNALVPVQDALERIYAVVERGGLADHITRYRERADRGVERMLGFARELQATARTSQYLPDVFPLEDAVREAAAVLASEGRHPTVTPGEDSSPVHGVRPRLVMALCDIVRNAYQAAGDDARVVLACAHTADGERARLTVDDDGPGVEPSLREAVFVDGYSTRRGGSGHGLALARTTIESDMRGTIRCEDGSELGGARFAIELPLHRGSIP